MMRSLSHFTRGCTLAITALTLTGCVSGGSTEFHRYTLAEVPSSSAPFPARHVLAVPGVRLSGMLAGNGIVMQVSDIELQAAQQNLWAGELGHQLTQRLQSSLQHALPATRIDSQPGDGMTLTVDVEQFQGRFDGQAVASGQYRVTNANGDVRIQDRFQHTVPLAEDGYPALVRALSTAWSRSSDQIAERIVALQGAPSSSNPSSAEAATEAVPQ
ncbi:PqiC family protein [Larsenimonas suaedae]|uniref:ABC-type transport auxiliary lipoprotein family protein n=1 Tax=Larsenimonas suaedae TaxID=1851019 RepID=A0ABU1GR47_9GAMM|nr:ABC-type transport auxiliary lipoprotein family protein [Larsenimonas suaedae]MCM2972703.1 ABC-type transport auxiliary lipoprotein family protein [Larsenimonas suaedae]MDR5894500.1 ABC-type transport auxiliary lipoprotein family protein [Larsenimonas suaedae]